jgi:hypothetical protein
MVSLSKICCMGRVCASSMIDTGSFLPAHTSKISIVFAEFEVIKRPAIERWVNGKADEEGEREEEKQTENNLLDMMVFEQTNDVIECDFVCNRWTVLYLLPSMTLSNWIDPHIQSLIMSEFVSFLVCLYVSVCVCMCLYVSVCVGVYTSAIHSFLALQ